MILFFLLSGHHATSIINNFTDAGPLADHPSSDFFAQQAQIIQAADIREAAVQHLQQQRHLLAALPIRPQVQYAVYRQPIALSVAPAQEARPQDRGRKQQ